MTIPMLAGQLASERQGALLAEAEQARRLSLARALGKRRRRGHPIPAGTVELTGSRLLRLPDGGSVWLRAIRPVDAPGLADAFERLSPASRRSRFLGVKNGLTAAELQRLTVVEHHAHEALIAVDPADRRIVGVARFVRSCDDPREAELAVTVVDVWHRRGVGRALMDCLTERARQEGVERFIALISDENTAARRLLSRIGDRRTVLDQSHGVTRYTLELIQRTDVPDLARAVAA